MVGFGNVFEVKNKDTGIATFYDDLSRNSVFEYISIDKKDSYKFDVSGLKIIEKDSRPSFIKITHKLIEKNLQHDFKLVFDGTHNYKGSENSHLNLTEDAKKVLENCCTCKNHFKYFNHYEITTIKNSVDADFIWEQVKVALKNNYFFENYTRI